MTTTYHVTALEITIYYNKEGDHDHNGLIFTLTENVVILKYLRAMLAGANTEAQQYYNAALTRAQQLRIPDCEMDNFLPKSKEQARQPHPLVRPLVLRVNVGTAVEVLLENEIKNRWVGLHLVGDGYDVKTHDGSDVGVNPQSLVAPYAKRKYKWRCEHEGVFPFHDGGDYSGGEDGTNVHGLFGALIVEPPGTTWRDPVTGRGSQGDTGTGPFVQLDGLYLDVLPAGVRPNEASPSTTTLQNHDWGTPQAYFEFQKTPHREYVIFFHDEPEFMPPHGGLTANPCKGDDEAGSRHRGGDHNGHGDVLPIMPVSYRAEPMINRERKLWQLLEKHDFKGRPVLNEEQHHSSWMFGDPATPILKAYIGDPVRIRFVHAAVKETHVFHLHLYEWHAVAGDSKSPRIDAISVSPQTAHTIEPVWGAGNRHQVAGDAIWHCHLYPHFHEGMWGMFRTFETRQDGPTQQELKDQTARTQLNSTDPVYQDRWLNFYPDGTPIETLLPLPDRKPPPQPTATHPGYPLYIPGEVKQKSPIPPWPSTTDPMPPDFDYRKEPTDMERRAFNETPVPGELFTRNPLRRQQAAIYAYGGTNTERMRERDAFKRNDGREVSHNVVVAMRDIKYNDHGWHDKHGHLYYLEAEGEPVPQDGPNEPLFFRAQHGQIVNVVLRNDTPDKIKETEFDHAFPPHFKFDHPSPPCSKLNWEGECATHVHMVKFDPICADGASTGWNYMSGATHGKKMVYRWWADQEFGTIFFHDHLFANYRQKHGLFGAMLVEPAGSRFFHHIEPGREVVTGLQAVIKRHPADTKDPDGNPNKMSFREFCIGIADFIPMWNSKGEALNPPDHPGGHGDQGVMALNYRNAPIRERLGDPEDEPKDDPKYDPANWFDSDIHGDPHTTRFLTYENDPVWFRVLQGSHEEQHSFQVHGMRWQRFRGNKDSAVRNQQTIGLSEAFTFINEEPYGRGDYLYKLSAADDLWLGCWGIIRSLSRSALQSEAEGLLPLADEAEAARTTGSVLGAGIPTGATVRHFHVVAEPQRLVYRNPDLVDPFGLVYRLTKVECSDGTSYTLRRPARPEPLVLRCREGEIVKVTLINNLPKNLLPEPFAPEVPVEERDRKTFRPDRPVSSRVSLHADLLQYDVRYNDGSNVGHNPDQTIAPGSSGTYLWRTNRPKLSGDPNAGQPLGPVLLQDMADFRNHRHHGLVGALVVEAKGSTPYAVVGNEPSRRGNAPVVWHGARVTLVNGAKTSEEVVLLLQDGLRLYLNGNQNFPIPDEPPGHGETETDHEDQGQKGFNYRTEHVGRSTNWVRTLNGSWIPVPDPFRNWLTMPNPSTPVWHVPKDRAVHFHLVGACDKPRNHSFTIHGVTWPEWRYLSKGKQIRVASESAISCGTARTFEFTPAHTGDHAYRSGMLKWGVPQGLWGILRVVPKHQRDRRNTIVASVSLALLGGWLIWRGGKGMKK